MVKAALGDAGGAEAVQEPNKGLELLEGGGARGRPVIATAVDLVPASGERTGEGGPTGVDPVDLDRHVAAAGQESVAVERRAEGEVNVAEGYGDAGTLGVAPGGAEPLLNTVLGLERGTVGAFERQRASRLEELGRAAGAERVTGVPDVQRELGQREDA